VSSRISEHCYVLLGWLVAPAFVLSFLRRPGPYSDFWGCIWKSCSTLRTYSHVCIQMCISCFDKSDTVHAYSRPLRIYNFSHIFRTLCGHHRKLYKILSVQSCAA